jgi:hypothetical protein
MATINQNALGPQNNPDYVQKDIPGYLCFPGEEAMRTRRGLKPLKEVWSAAFGIAADELVIIPFKGGSSDAMEIDNPNQPANADDFFTFRRNDEAANFNTTSLYQPETIDSIVEIMDYQRDWRLKRNDVAHNLNGLDAKHIIELLEKPSFDKAIELKELDRSILKQLRMQFFFGSGYGDMDEDDDILRTYVLPYVSELEEFICP